MVSGKSEEKNPGQVRSLELQNDKAACESNVNSHCSTGSMPTGSSSLLYSERNSVEGPSNAPLVAEISKEKQMGICGNLGGEVAETSTSAIPAAMSSDSIVAGMEIEKKCLLQSSLDSNEVSKNASETHDVSIAHNSKHVASLTHIMDNPDSDKSSGLPDRTAHTDKGEKKDDEGHSNRKKRVKRKKTGISSRSMTVSQRLGAIDKTTADIDLGILDALEVATKVALEVAREVDSGEPSRTSSEEISEESSQSGSEDSCDEDLHTGSPSKGLSVGESRSFEERHVGDNDVMDEDKPESGMMNSDDAKDKQLAASAKTEVGREKSPCGFDLNEDICLDEEVIPSGDLREKQVICLGIDLNEAEVEHDDVVDLTPWKQFPLSSSNYSGGESSHEANLRGSGRFNLDLNCTNEDDDMPPPSLKMETRLFLSHSGHQNAAPDSLSISQQSGKEINFDLNDRPQFFIDSRDQGPYYGQHQWSTPPYGGHKLDEPVISILGTKVDVDPASHMASFLSNGKSFEPATGLYMGRADNSLGLTPSVSFSPAPMYGYSGLTGPPGLSMSSSPMYVPGTAIPYMVDSRGTPLMMPQIIGSTPYMQPPYPQQHMFMSLASGSPNFNGSVRPNFDQSSGFGVQMGNRESLSLRQFLSPEQSGGATGEHSGANETSSSSSIRIGGKRKETETRWEFPPWR